jgi:hypothetical protein
MLQAAHRGYAYQDLVIATRLTDVLLGGIVHADVDRKLVHDDRFDDLTAIDANGHRERVQIKKLSTIAPLAIPTFTTERRSLKLDALLACALADRAGPGAKARTHLFRVVMSDALPDNAILRHVLRPATDDPGPFVPGMATVRLRFDPDALWPTTTVSDPMPLAASQAFAFLQDGRFTRAQLVWFCNNTIIELQAPSASLDLISPGLAERLLIDRVTHDIGAGSYPNENRSPTDVAAALIRTVSAARAGTGSVTPADLLRQAQLRQDFGAVARAHPIDVTVEVARRATTADVARNAALAADDSIPLLVIGPPGQGKSWICQRVQDKLTTSGWLVAEHYCFLGDADEERQARAHADRVIGSLLHRLSDADPTIVAEQRPRFSADDRLLIEAVTRARDRHPECRVALLIDGLDHVTRVLGATSGQEHPSEVLAERLAALRLPQGSVVIVLSQPGQHLQALRDVGALVMDMPGLEQDELKQLAERWHLMDLPALQLPPTSADGEVVDANKLGAFLDALADRSGGNALYATYLCREALRAPASSIDPVSALLSLPTFDGTLAAYYSHLCRALGDGKWVADIIALLDFAVSRAELREMRPDLGNRIDAALDQLGPVLIERAMQGGIRVYHESFSRYWLGIVANDPPSTLGRLAQVATWLTGKGLFQDSRAFRFLLPTLARANRFQEVVNTVDADFAWRSVAAGFTTSAIQANLATAAKCAASLNDWPAVVRCIELSRAAEAYEYERLETTLVQFSDVAMELLGADTFGSRLLFDGRTTVPARAGLRLCAQIDASGVSAPWSEYLAAFDRERKDDSTSYGEDSDREVSLAVLRGRLRLAASKPDGSVDLERLARYIETAGLPPSRVIDLAIDTLGIDETSDLLSRLSERGTYSLALAERLAVSHESVAQKTATQLAESAVNARECAGQACRFFRFGISADVFEPIGLEAARDRLLDLTRQVQGQRIQLEPAPISLWLDACAIAARRDSLGLATAEALIQGEGWYRCWLRFVIALCRAEVQPPDHRASEAINALKLLTDDLRPFVGDPRACDLYRLQSVIVSTLRRAIRLVSDALWPDATHILLRVSDETSTTLFGEMGGPLARDTLLDLLVSTSNSSRYNVNEAIIAATLSQDAGRRYYSDVAGFHLAAARLALMSGKRQIAEQHWQSATKLFVAYGWHKDTTIYELVDPLEHLVAVDREAVQERLEVLQPLCERVLFHTDRKETRGARARWWKLLAAADPLSLAGLTTSELLRHCNEPYDGFENARCDLWRAQCQSADAFVAGACRLTLKGGLYSDDAAALARLTASPVPHDEVSDLLRLLIARADERPIRYSYSNNAELLRADSKRVDEINHVVAGQGLPRALPLVLQEDDDRTVRANHRLNTSLRDLLQAQYSIEFDIGVKGLSRAIDLWRQRPYDSVHERWEPERFLNAIGYRLLDLLQGGRTQEAELGIRAVADAVSLSSERNLLGDIAEGLANYGFTSQAALAYTLHWTRTRGHGGWLNFGGITNLVSLREAISLDAKIALEVLAGEVDRALRGTYGSLGISQALILALGTLNWGSDVAWPNGHTSAQIAFLAWDEAARVIGARLPRVDASDDPELPYSRTQRPTTAFSSVDSALVMATFAGIGHPSREQKRRSLIAIQAIVRTFPELACEALGVVFQHLTEPATTAWLLASLQDANPGGRVVQCCRDHLARLATSPYLLVRTLARQLLSEVEPITEPLPLFDPIPELLSYGNNGPILIPDREGANDGSDLGTTPDNEVIRKAEFLLKDAAEARIALAEELVPGLLSAATAEVIRTIRGDSYYERRLRGQLESLCSRAEFRWPDAFVAPYEVAEEVLQRLGGSARVARALAGAIISDPVEWERQLATLLSSEPHVLLSFELTRVPRPDYPVPPGHYDPIWQQLKSAALGEPTTPGIVSAVQAGNHLAGTTFVESISTLPVCTDPRYDGWRAIAVLETRVSSPQKSWPGKDATIVTRCAAIEQRRVGDQAGLNRPPIKRGDLGTWTTAFTQGVKPNLDRTGPLLVTDSTSVHAVDGRNGLGYASSPLALSYGLARMLGLQPGRGMFELAGPDGSVAVVCRSWRAGYVVSDYETEWPILCGTDILVCPDVADRMLELFGSAIVWREYIEGAPMLIRAA